MPLTRPVGVFCVVPLAWHLWTCGRRSRWFWLLAPLAGWGAYFAAMGAMTGNAWEGFAAQRKYWPTNSAAHLLDPVGTLGAFLDVQGVHQFYGSLLDRMSFAAFLAGLSFWWRRDKEWWLWAVMLGVLPGILAWFAAYLRYAAMAFPAAVALAVWSHDKKTRDGILCGLAGLQAGWVWRHIHFVWAG